MELTAHVAYQISLLHPRVQYHLNHRTALVSFLLIQQPIKSIGYVTVPRMRPRSHPQSNSDSNYVNAMEPNATVVFLTIYNSLSFNALISILNNANALTLLMLQENQSWTATVLNYKLELQRISHTNLIIVYVMFLHVDVVWHLNNRFNKCLVKPIQPTRLVLVYHLWMLLAMQLHGHVTALTNKLMLLLKETISVLIHACVMELIVLAVLVLNFNNNKAMFFSHKIVQH